MISLLTPPTLTLDNPLIRGLACAALSPSLRSVLIFDAEPSAMRLIASVLAQMLERTTGRKVTQTQISVSEIEDDMWGQLTIPPSTSSSEISMRWKPGVLGSFEQRDELRLIVIPDLTQLSLAAARACVSAAGTEVMHLERHGQSRSWKPNLVWVAGCGREQIGAVSPHLLDRFALRLTGKLVLKSDRTSYLLAQMEKQPALLNTESVRISAEISQRLQEASQYPAKLSQGGLLRVGEYERSLEFYSLRRGLALARLALTQAQLHGDELATDTHVDEAANLIGLQLPLSIADEPEQEQLLPDKPNIPEAKLSDSEDSESSESSTLGISDRQTTKEPVCAPDQTEVVEPSLLMELGAASNPYPEDSAPIEREVLSLKLPPYRFRAQATARGAVIGVEPAQALTDLALVSTVLEAAKYQALRKRKLLNKHQNVSKLLLSPSDLRCYRRAVVAEQMLALLIDHTCLKEHDWQSALLPYLSWAYQERASVCLVQIGKKIDSWSSQSANGEVCPEELRATKLIERSILVPRVSAAIESGAGEATPLAHGLELVLQTLRHTLQHGRNRVQQALLVVVTDGRGNVPLEASYSGRIEPYLPVKRRGVEDALKVAEQIQRLDNLSVTLLNPQLLHHSELPIELAKSMKARVLEIPPIESWEVSD